MEHRHPVGHTRWVAALNPTERPTTELGRHMPCAAESAGASAHAPRPRPQPSPGRVTRHVHGIGPIAARISLESVDQSLSRLPQASGIAHPGKGIRRDGIAPASRCRADIVGVNGRCASACGKQLVWSPESGVPEARGGILEGLWGCHDVRWDGSAGQCGGGFLVA